MTSPARYAPTTADGVPNGGVSFWYAQTGLPPLRPPLPGDREADVCIVGGGLTGLWTAYYLKRAQPDLDVVVLEREFCGYGASGRNGGWLSAEVAAPPSTYLASHGEAGVRALHAQMRGAVEEVLAVLRREQVDADVQQDGILFVARSPAQRDRLAAQAEDERRWGARCTSSPRTRQRRASGSPVCAPACTSRARHGCSRPSSCRASRRPSSASGFACSSRRR
jgi:glycine/D-amino acid oxidase-like deaminating enzyme